MAFHTADPMPHLLLGGQGRILQGVGQAKGLIFSPGGIVVGHQLHAFYWQWGDVPGQRLQLAVV